MTARLQAYLEINDPLGNVMSGATVKFYTLGTGSSNGSTTSGTPYAGSLYATISGGNPISTTQTADSLGNLTVYTDSRARFDYGVELNGVAAIYQYQSAAPAFSDVTFNGEAQAVWNIAYYGLTAGAAVGNTIRTTNTTALTTLIATIMTAGGGRIYVPPGTWELNATVLANGVGTSRSLIFEGDGYNSVLSFYGTAGPLMDWAGTSGGPFRWSGMKNLQITCGNAMASGALIRLQTCLNFSMDSVWFPSAGATAGAWTAIQIGDPSLTSILVIPQEIHLTNVKTGLVSGSTGASLLIYSASGIYAERCDFTGQNNVAATSYGVRCRPNGTTAGNMLDTMVLSNCLIKDHQTGFRAGETGRTSNVKINGGHIDGIGDGPDAGHYATDAYGVVLQTTAGTIVENFQYASPWVAVYATVNGYGIYVDATTGTINRVLVESAGYITGCVKQSFKVVGAATNIHFSGIDVADATGNGVNAIEIGSGANIVSMHGNTVVGIGTTGACAVIAAGVTNFNITGNQGSGKSSNSWLNSAGTSATQIYANNMA